MNPSRHPPYPGRFITFEGIDGAGKSTHIDYVTGLLKAKNRQVVLTREPGGTGLGEKLREILLHDKMTPETEALLMFAARREHLADIIEPALRRGEWVLSDRFTDASFAYQGGGRGLAREKLRQLETWVHPHLQPDLTFLFDVSPDIAQTRLEAARSPDKFEREKADFFNRVRGEYLRRAKEFPERFRIIDSSRPIAAIRETLKTLIGKLD
ncbi:dTMP kinase [Oxalobacter paraformigenes]|uniref:Thymidylate kinase n=1 Tax=Oxalobacter paraformigenes TaxID=556268 RepID=C3X2Q8_9BURK|nr:dTMP kinase [Oxalobacter paraformigenes]EEO27494.1 thymidylate kinase [Oxalobacter paraformigenes]